MSWEQGRKSEGRQANPGRGGYGDNGRLCPQARDWRPPCREKPVFPRDAPGCGLRSASLAHEGGKVSHPSELQFSYWGAGNSPCLTVMTWNKGCEVSGCATGLVCIPSGDSWVCCISLFSFSPCVLLTELSRTKTLRGRGEDIMTPVFLPNIWHFRSLGCCGGDYFLSEVISQL